MRASARRATRDLESAAKDFVAPVQPVRAAPLSVGVVIAVVMAGTGVLVWQPWSAGSGGAPGSTLTSTGVPTTEATLAPPLPTRVPVAYASPRALPLLPAGSLVAVPPAERFRPRLSVVGVADLPGGEHRVTQVPVVTTSGIIEGGNPAEVCRVGRLRSAFVAILPARELRFIGIAAPPSGIASATQLTRVDRGPLAAYEVPVPTPEGDGQVDGT